MKYFLDTEFMEDGKTIDLLSIALVGADGREFYAVNGDAEMSKANDWVKQNVIPHLHAPIEVGGPSLILKHAHIGNAVLDFMRGQDEQSKPEFWGYYADYDWVDFCQLFGRMVDLPNGFPMYCRDLKQLCVHIGDPPLPKQTSTEHHALLDARWNRDTYDFLKTTNDVGLFRV